MVSILLSDKIDWEPNILEEIKRILCSHFSFNSTPRLNNRKHLYDKISGYKKSKLTGKKNNSIIIVGDISTPFLAMKRASRQMKAEKGTIQ